MSGVELFRATAHCDLLFPLAGGVVELLLGPLASENGKIEQAFSAFQFRLSRAVAS
jgi:hypothetical protein